MAGRNVRLPAYDRAARTGRAAPDAGGGDKGYDTRDFVADLRQLNVTPHVAQNDTNRRSATDGRTAPHAGYAVSQ